MFLVEEVQAGLPVEGAEFALKRVISRKNLPCFPPCKILQVLC